MSETAKDTPQEQILASVDEGRGNESGSRFAFIVEGLVEMEFEGSSGIDLGTKLYVRIDRSEGKVGRWNNVQNVEGASELAAIVGQDDELVAKVLSGIKAVIEANIYEKGLEQFGPKQSPDSTIGNKASKVGYYPSDPINKDAPLPPPDRPAPISPPTYPPTETK